MKTLSKRVLALTGALAIAISMCASVMAERTTTPASSGGTVTTVTQTPQDNTQDTQNTAQPQETDNTEVQTIPVPTPVAVQQETNVVETGQAQKAADKKYATKGFAFLWFFLSIIINAVLSFLIANRFYKLARKENHVASEVRALRRDLEEKFVKSVDGFAEPETDVTNTNDNYSSNGSVEINDRHKESYSKESDDIFRQWESKMSRRAARNTQAETDDTAINENAEEYEENAVRRVKKYQPNREIIENDSMEETQEISLKSKAKGLIENIFPFKD